MLQKWTKDAFNSEDDLHAKLLSGAPELDDAMAQLKSQKEKEEADLKARLEERRRRLKAQLKDEKTKIDEDLNSKDPIAEEELENKKNNILQQHNREAGSRDVMMNPGVSMMITPSVGMGDNFQSAQAAQEQSSAKQKQEQEANFQKLLQGIDTNFQTSQLLEALRNGDEVDPETLERLMKQDEEEQTRKLNERRELLRQRKALKKNQELEQLKMAEQLSIMQEEDTEKAKIGKTYLKDMFNQLAGAT